jgi:hypothetical protein
MQVVRDYFNRIRERTLLCLREAGIPLDPHRTNLRWSLQCGAVGMSIAVAHVAARELRGYGAVSERGAALCVHIQQDLGRLIDRVAAYLQQGAGRDLASRLARLEAAGTFRQAIRQLEATEDPLAG